MPESPLPRWLRLVRPQDLVWIPLFVALAATSDILDVFVVVPLVALGLVQVLEPKITAIGAPGGRAAWILFKLALVYLLIAYTGGIQSNFWLLLLLPVVSAATASGLVGTLVFTALAALAYLSFLLFLDWEKFVLERPEIESLHPRLVCLFMVGNLANALAEALRVQSVKHQRTAEQLAEANRQLVTRTRQCAAPTSSPRSANSPPDSRTNCAIHSAPSRLQRKCCNQQLSAENEIAREVAGFISTEVDRTNSLITRFLQFARPLKLRLEREDLAQLLDRSIAEAEREAPGIAVYRNYAPEIPPFPFDSELMERVFYNLVLNAAQATAPGGAVTVKTRAEGAPRRSP